MDGGREELHIVIELGPHLARFGTPGSTEQKSLLDSVIQFTTQLARDLALPVEPKIEISSPEAAAPAVDFTIKVNDQQCRLPLLMKLPNQASARLLANQLAAGIYENCELCLPRQVSEKLYKDWLPENQGSSRSTGPSFDEFHELLLSLIRRGFRIDRIREPITSGITEARVLAEKCVSGASTIKLYLSTQQAAISSFGLAGQSPDVTETSILETYKLMQDGLFYELGLLLPNLLIEVDDHLEENEFQFQINDLREPPLTGIDGDQTLVNDTADRLSLLGVAGVKAVNPANGNECALVRGKEAVAICRTSGLTTWTPAEFVILYLTREIRNHAGALLTVDNVEFLLRDLGRTFPLLVKTALARYDIIEMVAILRALIEEGISVKDIRGILEGLLAISGATNQDLKDHIVFFPHTLNLCQLSPGRETSTPNAEDYSNQLRTFFKKYISYKYTRGQSTLLVYLIDPQIETRLITSAQPLNLTERGQLILGVLNEVQHVPEPTSVILTTIEVRRLLRKLLEKEFPWLAVLSYQELSPDLNIQPLARISWDQ